MIGSASSGSSRFSSHPALQERCSLLHSHVAGFQTDSKSSYFIALHAGRLPRPQNNPPPDKPPEMDEKWAASEVTHLLFYFLSCDLPSV